VQKVILVIALLFSVSGELSQAAENCSNGGSHFDDGLVSGCEKTAADGKKTRFGRWIVRGVDESKIQEVNYNEAGEQDGLVIRYYPPESSEDYGHQQILEEARYEKNAPNGVWMYYYANGQKKEERLYLNGRLHGLRKSWNPQGTPNGEQCFIKDVRKHLEECSNL
jgi:antitoxin component YwqK of YwqJK toxin-antitoxin module